MTDHWHLGSGGKDRSVTDHWHLESGPGSESRAASEPESSRWLRVTEFRAAGDCPDELFKFKLGAFERVEPKLLEVGGSLRPGPSADDEESARAPSQVLAAQ